MRLVIKVGTQVISNTRGLSRARIGRIMAEIVSLLRQGHEIILVSSGAIGAGLSLVDFSSPLRKKIAAAVGQPMLMHSYIRQAKKHKIIVGQVLMLSDDFTNSKHFKDFVLNMEAMLANKVLPIINENDVMKRQDLRVNDNDMLGAMVAVGLKADKLIILTNKNGLYTANPDYDKKAKLIKNVSVINAKIKSLCSSGKSRLGVGGMLAKVKAAEYATKKGVETLIGNGEKRATITGAIGDNFSGTIFMAKK